MNFLTGIFVVAAFLGGHSATPDDLGKSQEHFGEFANLINSDVTTIIEENVTGVSFAGQNLSGAIIARTNATGTDFSDANLSGAMLDSSNFSGANFSGANLKGATLKTTWLMAS